MNSLLYVLKTGYKNKLKKAVRKPGFYVYIVFIGLYIAMMYNVFHDLVVEGGFNSPKILMMVLTAFTLYFTPMNYVSYAKRRGLAFLPSHVHFMFTSPVSPKLMLLFGQFQGQLLSFILELIIVLVGIFWFQIPALTMLIYFLAVCCFSLVAEGSLVVCLYGNEFFKEKTLKVLGRAIWLVLGALVAVTALYLINNGFSLNSILSFLLSDWICYIPLIGWQIGLMRLIILGPTTATLIGGIAYLLWGVFLVLTAIRMKCDGDYYEDAMKFADDYQKILDTRKSGRTYTGLKKSRVNKHVSVAYKGSGAKAIFYRQLLEYKKSRFFIFGGQTLIALIVAVGLPILIYMGELEITGIGRYYTIFGIMAYMYLVTGSIPTKWEKELENPYVYLIPAGTFSKMWYATLMEHIKMVIDALIMAVPYCMVMKLPLYYIVIIILGGTAMKAVKLYADTICNVIIGNSLGANARQLLRMLISFTIIGIAIPIVIVAHMLVNPFVAVLCGCLYLLVAAGALMLGGSHAFSRMEMTG